MVTLRSGKDTKPTPVPAPATPVPPHKPERGLSVLFGEARGVPTSSTQTN